MKTFAIAFAALALMAGAASAQDYRIPFGDLDMGSIEGANTFDARVADAARRACRRGSPLEQHQCRTRFRSEAVNLLPGARRDDYARARGARVLAMVPTFYG
jgi:UrcA family protein